MFLSSDPFLKANIEVVPRSTGENLFLLHLGNTLINLPRPVK